MAKTLYGKNLLEKVKLVQSNWVEAGTNPELCANPDLRHNVSNTVTVMPHMWSEVEDYVYDNRHSFAGISFLAGSGDKLVLVIKILHRHQIRKLRRKLRL
jgi:ribonucleoside-diphosphate reductase alpha chain